MQHKYCFKVVNRSLNDIYGIADHQGYFGKIPTILGDDLAQILPVVPRANPDGTVVASLQKSVLWPQFKILSLTTNMTVQDGENNAAFVTWLAKLSYESSMHGLLNLPNYVKSVTNFPDLVEFVYPTATLGHAVQDYSVFANRCILTFRNDTVAEFNSRVLQSLPEKLHALFAFDSADVNKENPDWAELPNEYLQTINPPGLPLSLLELKIQCPIVLVRNLCPLQGLSNRTTMFIINIGTRCL